LLLAARGRRSLAMQASIGFGSQLERNKALFHFEVPPVRGTCQIAMSYETLATCTDDRETILELWQRNLPTATTCRYSWLYRDGPARDWLLHDEEGDAIGSVGLMERRFRVQDRLVTAGQAVDMNVDQGHRSLGPALQLQRKAIEASEEQEFKFVYGLCDRRSQLVLRRMGYRLLGDVGRWAKPLTSEPFLPGWLRSKWMRRPACLAADIGMCLSSGELWQRRPKDTRVEVVDRYDDRFDRLWMRAAERLPILGERSAEYLNWRFGDDPDVRYRALTFADAEDELRGYLVYDLKGTTAHVADFLCDEPAHLAVLLPQLFVIASRAGMESVVVESLIPDSIAHLLRRFGFWRRPSNWPFLVYAPKADAEEWEEKGLFDIESWYLTRADVDTDG